jgi:hypothetical protein
MGPAVVLALALSAAQPAPTAPAPTPPTASAPTPTHSDASPDDPLYDGKPGSSVEATFQAAEGRRGALDGRWRLRDQDGTPLFEGAWRDLRNGGGTGDAGLLDSVRRDGETLTIIFVQPGAGAANLTLHPIAGGGWAGEMTTQAGSKWLVFLDRP